MLDSFWIATLEKALVCIRQALLLSTLVSCSSAMSAYDDEGGVEVGPAQYLGNPGEPLEAACRDWKLTSSQVSLFFKLSRQYRESPYGEYYQVPCSISGNIQRGGRTWKFEINGGGTGIWKNDEKTIHWGCHANQCARFVLIPSDGMGSE